MSFFEPLPPQPQRPPPGRHFPWVGPPENEIGASVPYRLLLARTPELAIALLDAVAFSTGFSFRLAIRFHPDALQIEPREVMSQLHGMPRGSGEDRLRFGIELSDGRRATNLEPRHPPSDEAPELALRSLSGGGGGGRSWQFGYWVYPLPPPGTITLAIAWPAHRVSEVTHSIHSAPIIEAAAESVVLWEDHRPIRSSGVPPQSGGIQTVLP